MFGWAYLYIKKKKKNKQLCYASYLGIVKIVSLNLYLRKKNIFQYTFILLYFNLHNNNQSKLIYNHKFVSEKEKKEKKKKEKSKIGVLKSLFHLLRAL